MFANWIFLYFCSGGMAEWSIAAVLKTVEVSKPPGVRIPLPPLKSLKNEENHRKRHFFGGFLFWVTDSDSAIDAGSISVIS